MRHQEETVLTHVKPCNRIRLIGNLLPDHLCIRVRLEWSNIQILLVLHPVKYHSDKILGGAWRKCDEREVVLSHLYVSRHLVSEDGIFFVRVGAQNMMIGT